MHGWCLLSLPFALLWTAVNSFVSSGEPQRNRREILLEVMSSKPAPTAHEEMIDVWMSDFVRALSDPTIPMADLFADEESGDGVIPFWRDMVAFSWNIITLEGIQAIHDFVRFLQQNSKQSSSSMVLRRDPRHAVTVSDDNVIECCALLETPVGTGRAHVRLKAGRAITLLTTLSDLRDCPFQIGPHRRNVVSVREPVPLRKYWHDNDSVSAEEDPYVVIVGAGQAGLSLGARLQALRVPYVILEAGDSPGEAWRQRYPSLCLHDPVYYNHLPYLHFPPTWPLFCPRDKIARWMELYAEALDLCVRSKARVVSAKQGVRGWSVGVLDTASREMSTLHAKHLVFATGNTSHPRPLPRIPGTFNGIQIHSSEYKGARHYRNRCRNFLVVGSNTSAMDIVQDLWEQLHDNDDDTVNITLLQRSSSTVVSTDSVLRLGLGPLWTETSDPEEADWRATTVPYRMALDKWKVATNKMRENDKALLDGLETAGFQLDFGWQGTGIFAKSASEGGGFYIDVGAATLISQRQIAVQHATLERFEGGSHAVVKRRGDGMEESIPVDCIIYATGFETLDKWVTDICGPQISHMVGRTWGIGLGNNPLKDPKPWEGELRNMWKPTAVQSLWFQGGNLAQNRHYSRFLALQLAARYHGVETLVYGIPDSSPIRSL